MHRQPLLVPGGIPSRVCPSRIGPSSGPPYPPNPKFAEHIDVPPRPLRGLSQCFARQNRRAEHLNMPQGRVQPRLRCSANFGLGEKSTLPKGWGSQCAYCQYYGRAPVRVPSILGVVTQFACHFAKLPHHQPVRDVCGGSPRAPKADIGPRHTATIDISVTSPLPVRLLGEIPSTHRSFHESPGFVLLIICRT